MGRILISEEEKKRILGMHKNEIKKNFLSEQTPQPTQTGKVAKPSIGFTEVAGSASVVPIKSASVLSNLGIPGVTPENFNKTFFYTNREGLINASTAKNLGTFTMKSKRTTESPDNVYAKYEDGSEVRLEGSGTKEFLTKGLTFIGGAGNGLLALSRALVSGTGKLPSKIKITLAGAMEGSSYRYNSADVNNTSSVFNGLLNFYIKPLVDPKKVSLTYPERQILLGISNITVENSLNRLLSKFLPKQEGKKVLDVAKEYGLDMTTDYFTNLINSSASTAQNIDAKWTEIENAIIAKYKENLDKFLNQKFPENKETYLASFSPNRAQYTPSEVLKRISDEFGSGVASPSQSPLEKTQSRQFKIGQSK